MITYRPMKLYAPLVNSFTGVFAGYYAEVPLSSTIPRMIDGEKDWLFRVVNSVKKIRNSRELGFILISDGFYYHFTIKNNHSKLIEVAALSYLKHKILNQGE